MPLTNSIWSLPFIVCPHRFDHDSVMEESCCSVCEAEGDLRHLHDIDDENTDNNHSLTNAQYSHPSSAHALANQSHQAVPSTLSKRNNDIWVCLVCGFVGCGESSVNYGRGINMYKDVLYPSSSPYFAL